MSRSMASLSEMCWRQPFTAAQWRELEHQALIFKYMIAGVPVPPDLLIPIHKSFETFSSRFYHHLPNNSSSLGYFSYYGKKLDPEPGRCRRTDGKKWRCSKDAQTDSKYCERHMHRSRNRSRKHVESKNNVSQQESQSHLSSSSTVTSHVAVSSVGSFQNNTMQFSSGTKPQGFCSGSSGSSPVKSDSQDHGMGDKEYRYSHGSKIEVDEHKYAKYPVSLHTALMASQVPSFPISKENASHLTGQYQIQLHSMQDLNEVTIKSVPKQQEQHHSYFKSDFGLTVPMRPAFNDWHKAKESWPGLDIEYSKHNSFSATQLSMSMPMTSSEFDTTSCCSPNAEDCNAYGHRLPRYALLHGLY